MSDVNITLARLAIFIVGRSKFAPFSEKYLYKKISCKSLIKSRSFMVIERDFPVM